MTKTRISNGMFIAMLINLCFVKSIGVTQGVLARSVGQDMWIATLLGTIQGIGVIYLTYLVIRKMPDKNIMEIGESLLGGWFGRAIGLIVFVFFAAGIGPLMLTFVYHLQEYFLPEAPRVLFVAAAMAVGMVGCYYGLEVMARIALVGILFIFLLNALIVVGSVDEFDIRNLLPVLESGFPRTLAASIHLDSDWALSTMLAALIYPAAKDFRQRGALLGIVAIAASGLLIIIWSLLEGAVLSAEVTSQYTLSCMKLARNAHIGHFLQRYEMIMISLYSIPMLFEVMICLYGATLGAAKLCGLKTNTRTVLPAGIVLGVFGYWIVEDHFVALYYLERIWPWIALPIAVGLPVTMLIVQALFGGRKT